ncbi:MAG: hypothetical protein ABR499_19175 [Gemmatimonadaceae bacterium]
MRPARIGEQFVIGATAVLLAPLTILNMVLPRGCAPRWPVAGVVLTSVVWGFAAYAIARWRERRRGAHRNGSAGQ